MATSDDYYSRMSNRNFAKDEVSKWSHHAEIKGEELRMVPEVINQLHRDNQFFALSIRAEIESEERTVEFDG